MAQQETILAWLKDAYAMERGSATAIEKHAQDAKDHPELQFKLNQHLEETNRHAELIESCITRLGDSTSSVKTGLANVSSWLQSITSSMTQDEVVKNVLTGYSAEHFEIACYTSLIAAARQVGDQETARVCETILAEEQATAQWLEDYIPTITQEFVTAKAAEH